MAAFIARHHFESSSPAVTSFPHPPTPFQWKTQRMQQVVQESVPKEWQTEKQNQDQRLKLIYTST